MEITFNKNLKNEFMKYIVSFAILITILITCKKEEGDLIKGKDHINLIINNNFLVGDSSYWSNVHSGGYYLDDLSQFGFRYFLDSNTCVKISLGMLHKFVDYNLKNPCKYGYKLKDEIFYEIFKLGNFDYFSCCVINDLSLYDVKAEVELFKNSERYSTIRNDGNNCSTNSENSFKIEQIEIIKKNLDWSDCEHSHRILRIEGYFECYVYKTNFENNKIDSLKLTCNDFIGTIQN
jgi:hypothetical protein